VEAAAARLGEEAGKAFDPSAVAAFLRILPVVRAEIAAADAALRRPSLPRRDSDAAIAAGAPEAAPARSSVFEDIAIAHREIYALYEIAQTMGTSLGVPETMEHIAAKLNGLVPFSACALFVYDETSDVLSCRFATGTDADALQQLTLRSGQGLSGWVARNRRPLVNGRPSADLDVAGSSVTTTLQSSLVCPLIAGDRFIGTLAMYHTTPAFYREDHRRLLERVCEQAAAVIRNAGVFEQTQEASLTDPLTGLPNSRHLLMHVARELARATRLGSEVSLLVMDLNNFKDINDGYGHHVGDRALREVAKLLRATIRPYDICVRYAGDEFIVVLVGCGRDEAENKRIELQRAIDEAEFEAVPGMTVPLSISVGAAVFPADGDSYEWLLATADSRMYQHKSARKRDGGQQLQSASDALPPQNSSQA
jgi:diguanylate cyclase (GGDEF)-like protein